MNYISTLMGVHVGVLVVSLMDLQLALIERNLFRPCSLYLCIYISCARSTKTVHSQYYIYIYIYIFFLPFCNVVHQELGRRG